MYKNNKRDSSNIMSFSPLKLTCSLTEKYHAVGYYSYTKRSGDKSNRKRKFIESRISG